MTDILVIGYPKVGGSWLSRLLGDALNSPVGAAYKPFSDKAICTEGQDRQGDYYIGQGHLMPIRNDISDVLLPNDKAVNLSALKDEKIIVMYRDPRDVIVSANHHWGIDDIHKTIELVAKGEWPLPHGGGLEPFYKAWWEVLKETPSSIGMARYEWLSAAPRRELKGILSFMLGEEIPDVEITNVVGRQSFPARCRWTEGHGDSLNYGKTFQLRFLRKGIVGDWKNVFDQRAIEMCQEYFGDLMRGMGYT